MYSIFAICFATAVLSFNLPSYPASQSTEDVLSYMEQHQLETISRTELQKLSQAAPTPPPPPPTDENCTTCNEITYCGLDSADLIQYIDNYRDSVWSKTSPYFNSNPYDPEVLFNGSSNLTDFDARFMDLNLAMLENYICTIKNSTQADNVNTIRFYYIRYNENSAPLANFEWKHSLAMVPVRTDENGLTQEEFVSSLERSDGDVWNLAVDVNNFCANTPLANHNRLCPPFTGCQHGTLLEQADLY